MKRPSNAVTQGPLALYLHVPFCGTKCNYCDFNTYAGIENLMPSYVDALVSEVETWGRLLDERARVGTVFFGGGTPSLLPVEQTRRILEACARTFDLAPDAEVTLESNPGDLTPQLLDGLLAAGINRLSIGAQSFNDVHLAVLTRRHSAREAADAYRLARDAGYADINLDLMYGLPRQSLDEWRETLDEARGLGPDHLSLYALTLEEGTPLWSDVTRGAVPDLDSDLAAEMYLHAEEALDLSGYAHYEISNWALPGHECRHNLVYWRNGPYLGMGAGAHSSYGGYRFFSERNPRRYIDRVAQLSEERDRANPGGRVVSEAGLRRALPIDFVELIDRQLEMGETMMLGLRLMEGVGHDRFKGRFGRSLESVFGPEIRDMVDLGLLTRGDGSLRLTPRGRLLGNEVFGRFLSVGV